MKQHRWNDQAPRWAILLLAAILMGILPGPAGASDKIGAHDPSSDTPAVMTDMRDSEGDAFEEFESFEEFEHDAGQEVFDPLSGYNRFMTRVNDRLYYWVLKPAAKGYRFVVARPVRESIDNFFRNLGFPVRAVNNLLQLKFKRTGTETMRFVVNTTVGIAGLRDPATTMMKLPVYSEDFGQTLGRYGLGGGFHLVLPLFGPSNARDACGKIADWALDPVTYLEHFEVRAAINALDTVNDASLRIGQYEAITRDAVDLYILLRDGYRDRRDKNIEE